MNNIYNTNNINEKNRNVQILEARKNITNYYDVQKRNRRTKSRTKSRTSARDRIITSSRTKKKQGGTYSPNSAATKIQDVARINMVKKHLKFLTLYDKLPDDIRNYAYELHGINVNISRLNYAKYTFLKAIIHGNFNMINFLFNNIDIYIDIDDENNIYDAAPLIIALSNLKNIEETKLHKIIKLLLKKEPDINAIDIDEGNTVLHLVNNSETAKLLIKKGANVNALNNAGETPLFYAHKVEVANTLIKNGADINILSYDHETPIFGLIRHNNSLNSVKLLLINLWEKNKNLSINKCNKAGNTLLHVIAKDPLLSSKLNLTKFLISLGIKLHGPGILHMNNHNNETPYSIFEKSKNSTILSHIHSLTVTNQIYKVPMNVLMSKMKNNLMSKMKNKVIRSAPVNTNIINKRLSNTPRTASRTAPITAPITAPRTAPRTAPTHINYKSAYSFLDDPFDLKRYS